MTPSSLAYYEQIHPTLFSLESHTVGLQEGNGRKLGVSMLKAWLSSRSIQSNPIPAHNNILGNKPGYRYVWNPRCQHNLSHCINNFHLRCPLHKQFKHKNQEIVQIICINLPKLNEHKAAENKNHTCTRSRVPSFYTKQIQPSQAFYSCR